MKKNVYLLCVPFLIFCLSSCVDTIYFYKAARTTVPQNLKDKNEPVMEFIGFKNNADSYPSGPGDVREQFFFPNQTITFPSFKKILKTNAIDDCLSKLGRVLEESNVAYDKQYAFLGNYSLGELGVYKSKKRFITFIGVNEHRLDGVFSIFLAKTSLTFQGLYQIYVYDTLNKEIIYKDSVSISENGLYSGSYFHKNTNRNRINSYYATLVYNKFLEKFSDVVLFLENYE